MKVIARLWWEVSWYIFLKFIMLHHCLTIVAPYNILISCITYYRITCRVHYLESFFFFFCSKGSHVINENHCFIILPSHPHTTTPCSIIISHTHNITYASSHPAQLPPTPTIWYHSHNTDTNTPLHIHIDIVNHGDLLII